MSPNKATVQRYMDGFNATDHDLILSCLSEDIEWIMPGYFRLSGKAAFDREIENDAFIGSPAVQVRRMIEEDDVVVAEGEVSCKRRDGGYLEAVFCDVFEMENAKIRRLTSYLANLTDPRSAGFGETT